jgi:hypothetical protein
MTNISHLPRSSALRLALGILLLVFPLSSLHAQLLCGDSAALASQLSVRYREKPFAQGVTAAGRMLRFFVSEAGTWTTLVVLPDARACVVSHGEGWQRPAEPEGRAGQPS